MHNIGTEHVQRHIYIINKIYEQSFTMKGKKISLFHTVFFWTTPVTNDRQVQKEEASVTENQDKDYICQARRRERLLEGLRRPRHTPSNRRLYRRHLFRPR